MISRFSLCSYLSRYRVEHCCPGEATLVLRFADMLTVAQSQCVGARAQFVVDEIASEMAIVDQDTDQDLECRPVWAVPALIHGPHLLPPPGTGFLRRDCRVGAEPPKRVVREAMLVATTRPRPAILLLGVAGIGSPAVGRGILSLEQSS
jgi:hypothetical protein